VNTRHIESYQSSSTSDQEASKKQRPSTLTLCTNSAHRYQNKDFINHLFSHTCAHLRPYPLCFDTLHKNTRGEGMTPTPTVPSRIGIGGGWGQGEAERFLASRIPLGMMDFENIGFGGTRMSELKLRPPREEEGTPRPTLAYTRPARMRHPRISSGAEARSVLARPTARLKSCPPKKLGSRWTLGTGHLPLHFSVMLSGGPLLCPACPDPRGELRGAALLLQRPAQNLGERYFKP
jgi:hypothetical protein